MTPLHIAIRSASFLTDNNVESMQAENVMLLADAIQSAIGYYWDNGAPEWVKSPETAAAFVTIAGDNSVALPLGFDALFEDPELTEDGGVSWTPLYELSQSNMQSEPQGIPRYYRVKSAQAVGENMAGETFGRAPVASLELYPTPAAVYTLRVRCRFTTPQITDVMLSALHRTIEVPIPRDHLIRIVIPLTAAYLIGHPMAKPTLEAIARIKNEQALQAMAAITHRRGARPSFVGTPRGF